MKVGFLITARLKSSRLKLKLLKPLHGRNAIERVIDRAKEVFEIDDIILCTSLNKQDLPLVKIAIENDIYYYNGSEEDVLQRMLEAAELFNLDYIIGITADNPLFSIYHANIISDMVRADKSLDYVYTTGMPIGVNIYAIKTLALKTVCQYKEEIDTEIWGALINRPEIFNISSVTASKEYQCNIIDRLTLDYIEDYLQLKEIFQDFKHGEVVDILEAYQTLIKHPNIAKLNAHIKQLDLSDAVKKRINLFFLSNQKKILNIKNRIYSL